MDVRRVNCILSEWVGGYGKSVDCDLKRTANGRRKGWKDGVILRQWTGGGDLSAVHLLSILYL